MASGVYHVVLIIVCKEDNWQSSYIIQFKIKSQMKEIFVNLNLCKPNTWLFWPKKVGPHMI
jgi:hypothetical protein